jgi:hypothetical protein
VFYHDELYAVTGKVLLVDDDFLVIGGAGSSFIVHYGQGQLSLVKVQEDKLND